MVHQNNPRAFHSPEEEDLAAGSQNQQHATPQLSRSRRRRWGERPSEREGRHQAMALQGDQ